MKTKIYAIYDSKAESYMQPFFQGTHGLALRTFEQHVQNPETIFSQHPADFTLFYIGEFDESNAKIEPELTPTSLGVAIEFIQTELESVK